MVWKRLLAYITGSVDQDLLLRNEYLVTENRVLRNQIKGRLRLSDPERMQLAEIGKRLGRKALAQVAQIVRPETILGWHRKLIARKFDGSRQRGRPARPDPRPEIEELVVRMAKENRHWGYRRIMGALANLGHEVSHQTVANLLARNGVAGLHSIASGSPRRGGLLHGGGVDQSRADDLLRADMHAGRVAERLYRWGNAFARCCVDEADGQEPDVGGRGLPEWMQIPAARSGWQVLRGV